MSRLLDTLLVISPGVASCGLDPYCEFVRGGLVMVSHHLRAHKWSVSDSASWPRKCGVSRLWMGGAIPYPPSAAEGSFSPPLPVMQHIFVEW